MRAWGRLKRGFDVLALCEMCFSGHGGGSKEGLRCWHWVKCVLRAWGQWKWGLRCWHWGWGEMCFEGMGAVEKGV